MESQESAADILAERDALRVEVSDLREDVLELNDRVLELRGDLAACSGSPELLTAFERGLLVTALSLIGSLAGGAAQSGRGSNHSSATPPAGEA